MITTTTTDQAIYNAEDALVAIARTPRALQAERAAIAMEGAEQERAKVARRWDCELLTAAELAAELEALYAPLAEIMGAPAPVITDPEVYVAEGSRPPLARELEHMLAAVVTDRQVARVNAALEGSGITVSLHTRTGGQAQTWGDMIHARIRITTAAGTSWGWPTTGPFWEGPTAAATQTISMIMRAMSAIQEPTPIAA